MSHQASLLITICQHLHQRNLLAAADGNVSIRLDDDTILITPTGINKAQLTPKQLAIIDLSGTILQGNPSSERLMHLAIYNACPHAKAVVHAHPPTAIAWSLAKPHLNALPSDSLPEVILAAGHIPIAPYARPGTAAMGDVLLPFLPEHRLFILARHGGLCWGESLEEASNGIERLEQVSQILLSAELLGGAKPLDTTELLAIRALRQQLGPKII